MPFAKARLSSFGFFAARIGYSCGLAVILFLCGSKALQNAIAEGDTRTISMHHVHTDEDITITYKRDGRYDQNALDKLDWFLRDWRRGEATRMDPHLIDLVWEVQRETGSKQPIQVICGYRSPQTNEMLRHRSRGVARYSQHMLGHAMDFYIPGVPLEELRVIGLRLQRGGVGFYPTSGSPFVHMDTGNVRMWPRMTRDQLVRVFPDGRTVLIPSDGRPLPGYALALADVRQRGNDPSENSIETARNAHVDVGNIVADNERHFANPLAKLFGLAKNEDQEEDEDTAAAAPAPPRSTLLAAIERKSAATAAAAERAAKVAKTKLIQTASLVHVTRAEAAPAPQQPQPDPSRLGAVTPSIAPSQVITTRGYWDGSSGGIAAVQPGLRAGMAERRHRLEVASADPDATGSVSPWPGANDDRVPPELALAYTEQPERQPALPAGSSSRTPSIIAVSIRNALPQEGYPAPQSGTTIAIKRAANQAISTILTAPARSTSTAAPGARFDNPWLLAMVLSPSVRRFLTTVEFGAQDYRTLTPLMSKPADAVMMTFSADPNPGLTQDRFSGAAVVFMSTVNYLTHTASLQ